MLHESDEERQPRVPGRKDSGEGWGRGTYTEEDLCEVEGVLSDLEIPRQSRCEEMCTKRRDEGSVPAGGGVGAGWEGSQTPASER